MRILVTGASGQLGSELQRLGPGLGVAMTAGDVAQLDIVNLEQVRQALHEAKPQVVVNAAAYTAVDKAETDEKTAFAVNRDGPANLAKACAEARIPLIHVSTDYVFDGRKSGPYREHDETGPMSVYGSSKEAGEREVRGLSEHVILRTSWVYSPFGNNFVKTILKLARERPELKIIDDQHGSPTAAQELAKAILELVVRYGREGSLAWGTYHYCGHGTTSWFGFAQAIVEMARGYESLPVQRILPIPTTAYPLPAKRPQNSVLDCSLFETTFSHQRKLWQESLQETIRELYAVKRA